MKCGADSAGGANTAQLQIFGTDRPSNVTFALKSNGTRLLGTLRMTDAGLEYQTGLSIIIC